MDRAQLNVKLSKSVIKRVRLNAVLADKTIEEYMETTLRKTLALKEPKTKRVAA